MHKFFSRWFGRVSLIAAINERLLRTAEDKEPCRVIVALDSNSLVSMLEAKIINQTQRNAFRLLLFLLWFRFVSCFVCTMRRRNLSTISSANLSDFAIIDRYFRINCSHFFRNLPKFPNHFSLSMLSKTSTFTFLISDSWLAGATCLAYFSSSLRY